MNFDLDVAIFLIFLVVTLFVGLRYSKDIKTIQDYALGGRNFSTLAIVSTILATYVSGSMFFVDLSHTYSDGFNYFIPSISMCLQVLIIGVFFVPRMKEFLGNISVAEAMGNLYGTNVRIITAFSGIAGTIGGIAVQFKVFGTLFNYFLGIPSTYAILIASFIVILYSALGGIRAVTHTDILQSLTFTFALPIVGFIIWMELSNHSIGFDHIANNPNFDIRNVLNFNNPELLSIIFLTIYFSFPTLGSMEFQRIAIGKNVAQVKKAFIVASLLLAVISVLIAAIPVLILSIDDTLDSNNLLSYIIDNYTYTGLKGLIIIGVSAMAMSTADSRINSAAVLFAHDIGKTFKFKINELFVSKIFSFILGIFGIYLALSNADLLSIVMASAGFYMPVVSVPLVLSILGFRSSGKSVLIAMIGGILFISGWKIAGIQIDGIVPGMFFNLLLLFSSHYLLKQPGGWINTKDEDYHKERARARKIFKNKIKHNIANFNFVQFCINNALHNEVNYTLFGIFGFITSLAIIYVLPTPVHFYHSQALIILYQSMMVISNFFLLYLVWSPKVKNKTFISIVWNISVVYLLCFCSTFFLLLSSFHKLVLVVFIVDIIVMFSLVRWRVAIPMIIFGVSLGIISYLYYIQIEGIRFAVDFQYSDMIYIILLISTVFITIIKPAQYKQELVEQKIDHQKEKINYQKKELKKSLSLKYEFLRNLQHETNNPLAAIKGLLDVCYTAYDQLSDADKKKCLESAYDSSTRLCSYISNMTDLSKLTSMNYKFKMEKVDLEQLVYDRVDVCKKLYVSDDNENNNKQHEFIYNIQESAVITCDKYYITQVIDNIIINAIQYSEGGKITIEIKCDEQNVTLSVKDEGVGIPKEDMHDIFGAFIVSSVTKTPAGGRGVGLALCKKIIDLHSGSIRVEQNPDKGSKFIFTLPKVQKTKEQRKKMLTY